MKQTTFTIEQHKASNEHYNLNVQTGTRSQKWVIPQGLSMDPKDKRVAVEMEKPAETIQKPEDFAIWDKGTVTKKASKKGIISLVLQGKKIKGAFGFMRIKGKNWLLFKQEQPV